MPVEPPVALWDFPDPRDPAVDEARDDLVAIGADIEPGTLLSAYRRGLFPMPADDDETMMWFSPRLRGALPLDGLVVTRSLRKSAKGFEVRVDTAFDEVVVACADPTRDGGWIDDRIRAAYGELHRLGWAHSVETWRDGRLAGGLYGVSVGGLFAGESMFHRHRDASKVALIGLVELLSAAGDIERRVLDVQWATPHLASLGVIELERTEYLRRLDEALGLPDAFAQRT